MSTVKSPLREEARTAVGKALQASLVDLLDMALTAKQAHWNITGRNFRSLHLQLDEIVEFAREHADSVAERAVAIGVNPDGRASTIAQSTRIPQLEAGYLQDDKVIAAFTDLLGQVIHRFRERIAATEEADLVTQDLFIEITAGLEKQYWMLSVQN
ncbi:Dps family protein [Actinomadura alba]|uniref:DNA starvation/stationary phase protection protein n=1 Tax=Actinomadura alba TaxID=406431 RepID=A0ABR7LGZ2_9ACTN|nr:DNA starvation/stationary phase protection protein [Actinomadura alba]MBC6464055.1 DNA starvation/stationary phase protection protein [Actinomadura alba]